MPLYARMQSERFRAWLRRRVLAVEGGPLHSLTVREMFRRFHRVEVGLYSAGPCEMPPNVFHPGTKLGRYCCIAETVRTFTRNHPMDILSTHGFFYNPGLGKVRGEPIQFNSLNIGHGVCIGHNAIVLPPTTRIGDGAIIGPGSVVCTDIPPYAIVSGYPARVTGYRFDKEIIAELIASCWWEKAPAELTGGRWRELLESTAKPEALVAANAGAPSRVVTRV